MNPPCAACCAGTRYAALLKLSDPASYTFNLTAAVISNRPGSDATYDPLSGFLSMRNVVLNDTTERYDVEMETVPNPSGLSFRLRSLTVAR